MNKKVILYIIGILYLAIFIEYNIGIPCIFHELTGLYCPGCGATRAIAALIKLNFYQAIRYNLIIIVLLPLFIIYSLYQKKEKIPKIVFYIISFIIIMFGILRNIPYFSFLSPIDVI